MFKATSKSVSQTETVAALFVLLGVLLLLSRRESFSLILYVIASLVLIILVFYIFIALNAEAYAPLGTSQFNVHSAPALTLTVNFSNRVGKIEYQCFPCLSYFND